MNSPCDPADPIETLIDQIEDVIDCAASGDMFFTPKHIVNLACDVLFDTGVFANECKATSNSSEDCQTWEDLKITFTKSHQCLRE